MNIMHLRDELYALSDIIDHIVKYDTPQYPVTHSILIEDLIERAYLDRDEEGKLTHGRACVTIQKHIDELDTKYASGN